MSCPFTPCCKACCRVASCKRQCVCAGLGRKSVACIMLLCLGMPEFPVDVNVGRICSRLGWIPLDSEQALEASCCYAKQHQDY